MAPEGPPPVHPQVSATEIPLTWAEDIPSTSTPTPFQPLSPTHPLAYSSTVTPQPGAEHTISTAPSLNFYGIDFSNGEKRIRIKIIPEDRKVNAGKPIVISFLPGEKCIYGDQHACIHAYQTDSKNSTIFITTHSGISGEAEEFRYAVEGMGLNRSGFSLARVHSNLSHLRNADVIISQAGIEIKGLKLTAAGRVPATGVERYFSMPIEQALKTASSMDPRLIKYVNPNQLQLVFETCGWKMPGEPWAPGVTSTTGSVYLGVIQKEP